MIAADRIGYRLMFGLSTRDQDALVRKVSNKYFVWKSLIRKLDILSVDVLAHLAICSRVSGL
ncbi:hypothetical protein ACVWWP_001131 [Bradyrhizobium sp. LM3.6]